MKKTDLMTMTAAMVFAASGYVNAGTPVNADKPIIGKQEIRIKDKNLLPKPCGLWDVSEVQPYLPTENRLHTPCPTIA